VSVAPSPSFTPPPQTQFSYVTQTTLLGVPVPSSSVSLTLSDPDAVPTTVLPSKSLSGPASEVPLPSNLPARIYSPEPIDPKELVGHDLISIKLDSVLLWRFVSENTQSQGQIFLWLPSLLSQALGVSVDTVKMFALQVYVSHAYNDASDTDQLFTLCLVFVPSNLVAMLANQIKVGTSPIYTTLGDPYASLAAHFDRAYGVVTVDDSNAIPGTPRVAGSQANKSRADAIIGVVSALGGLALIILGVLVFRSIKRSRELRHRRLSEPSMPNDPYPDRAGRDFDQDSVGGQRRRSFYFAEDSLRGQQQTAAPAAQVQTEHSFRTSPESMRERRVPVVPSAISAPILTQSSLNW
jgi:hypothetical protein